MLSDAKVRSAKPREKTYKIYDEDGLYLEVPPSGNPRWRWRYRFRGKESRVSLGVYPKTSLKQARAKRDEMKEALEKGASPAEQRKAKADTFEALAMEWYVSNVGRRWNDRHAKAILCRLKLHVFPRIGERSLLDLEPPEFLGIVKKIEQAGARETAHRVLMICSQICRYGVATYRMTSDPCRDLRGALVPVKKKHFPTLTDTDEIRTLVRGIDAYPGEEVRVLMTLQLLTFVRPGEARLATWDEFDLDAGMWTIPAARMKMGREHLVPLARQTVALLKEWRAEGFRRSRLVFPALRAPNGDRPLSDSTVLMALRAMGWEKEQFVAHSFRSLASTRLNEMGYNPDVIEKQLAHEPGNAVRVAYNRAQWLPDRIKLMQDWADFLDSLRNG